MFQELLHFFSFILCAAGLGVTVIGILLAVCAVTTPLIRHKVMAAVPFLSMILGGSLGTYFGWKGINSIPTPKTLEIQAPVDSVIRAEVIRNGHVIHQEEI
jgi:hypothetical protein